MGEKIKTRAVSVTLPEDLIGQARAAVAAGEARSVSAWITERLRSANERDPYDEFIAGIVASNPELTVADWRRISEDVRAEFDAAYGHGGNRRTGRAKQSQRNAA